MLVRWSSKAQSSSSFNIHGHTLELGCNHFKEKFANLTIMAGNVTSGEGLSFLVIVDEIIKVGPRSSSICTTRIVAGVEYPK